MWDENGDAPVDTAETQGLTWDHCEQLDTEKLAERQEMGKFPDHTNYQNESLNIQKARRQQNQISNKSLP